MKDTIKYIKDQLQSSERMMNLMLNDDLLIRKINDCAEECVHALSNGKKLMFAGNGGSAADAQHMAAEYVGRFQLDRPSLPAVSLTTDTSILTSIGNDYGFDTIFERQINSLGNPGDVFFAYSTSGNSQNIIKALSAAKVKGLVTIGLTGGKAGGMNQYCDFLLDIPHIHTPKIQEGHLVVGHLICGIVEELMFGTK